MCPGIITYRRSYFFTPLLYATASRDVSQLGLQLSRSNVVGLWVGWSAPNHPPHTLHSHRARLSTRRTQHVPAPHTAHLHLRPRFSAEAQENFLGAAQAAAGRQIASPLGGKTQEVSGTYVPSGLHQQPPISCILL